LRRVETSHVDMLKAQPSHGERGVALEPPDRPRAHRRCLALVARGTAHVARSDIALDVSDCDVLQVDAARPAQSWWRQEEILAAAAVHVVARHYAAYMHAQRKETPLVCLMLVPSLSGQIRGFHEESGATQTLRCYTYTSIASESIYHRRQQSARVSAVRPRCMLLMASSGAIAWQVREEVRRRRRRQRRNQAVRSR
jgi:hypothetical protein